MSPATTPEEDTESASLLSTPKDTPEGSSAEEDHEEETHDMSTVSEDKDSESADPKEADPEEEGEEEYGVGHEEPQAPQKGEAEDGINPPPSPEVEPAGTAHSSAFSLTSDDTGERLVPALAKIVRHPNFSNKISVTATPLDLARLERAMRENDLDCTSQDYVAGPDGSGYSNLYISADKSEFKWPDFSQAIEKPTDDEVEEFLEGVVGHPQKDRVHYCCGVASVPFDNPLHPGEVLARFEDLTIANEQYYHAGWSRSATPFHCEDAGFWSCNRTEVGWKVWIMIPEHHTAKFEKFIRRNWTCGQCDQFVRHCNILIAPSRLREEGIDFDIHCSGPGDMIITKPRQYHAVVNFLSCFARSINFLLPGEEPLPEKLLVCKDCGLYPLHPKHSHVQVVGAVERLPRRANKRKATDSQRNTRTSSALTREINETVELIKGIDPMCSIPPYDASDLPKPKILKLAAAIRSLPVVLQFTSFVKA